MITEATNKARALIVIKAMCHGSRYTWETTGEVREKNYVIINIATNMCTYIQ